MNSKSVLSRSNSFVEVILDEVPDRALRPAEGHVQYSFHFSELFLLLPYWWLYPFAVFEGKVCVVASGPWGVNLLNTHANEARRSLHRCRSSVLSVVGSWYWRRSSAPRSSQPRSTSNGSCSALVVSERVAPFVDFDTLVSSDPGGAGYDTSCLNPQNLFMMLLTKSMCRCQLCSFVHCTDAKYPVAPRISQSALNKK